MFNDMDGYAGGTADDASGVDTALPDTAVPDTAKPDTAVVDSGKDSGTTDTRADTFVADTFVPDTSVSDTFVADTFVADTFVADTFVADTFVADTADTSVPDGPVGCHLVINELQTGGTSGVDEFIELYNPCDAEIAIAGWKLSYRSATGTTESSLVAAFGATAKVAAKGFFVAANSGGTFAAAADATWPTSGLAATGGGVGLRDSGGALVDSVAWGAGTTNAFIETAAAPAPSAGESISRVPAGKDTNNNSVDFVKTTPSTPKS